MKLPLFCFFILLLAGCANNQQKAIVTLCKEVKNSGKACGTVVGLTAKCAECTRSKENIDIENTEPLDISPLELQKNSMIW
jgi:hypothetical protein